MNNLVLYLTGTNNSSMVQELLVSKKGEQFHGWIKGNYHVSVAPNPDTSLVQAAAAPSLSPSPPGTVSVHSVMTRVRKQKNKEETCHALWTSYLDIMGLNLADNG